MSIADKFEVIADAVYDKGVSDGKKSEYDEFWDNYQDEGNRVNYQYAFYKWSLDLFYPKYDIKPTEITSIFHFAGQNGSSTCDMINRLKECNVKMDFSEVTNARYCFYYTGITTLPTLDFSNCTTLRFAFMHSSLLEKIEKLKVSEKVTSYENSFTNCTALKDIVIEGIIGATVSFEDSKLLNRASIESIVKHLSTTQGATLTLSAEAVNREFSGEEWETFIAEYKPSTWSIALK